MWQEHRMNQGQSAHTFPPVISTCPCSGGGSTTGQMVFTRHSEIARCYCQILTLGISSSNGWPGYSNTSKKANYNVVLLVSGVYSLLLHRLLFFSPFWAFQTKSHRTRDEGKSELKVAVLPAFTYTESSTAAFLAIMGDSRMKLCVSLFMSI